MDNTYRAVIGIDFGTSRTGYAFAFVEDGRPYGELDWPGQPAPYPKAPTQLLYRPSGDLHERGWGYQASREFAQLRQSDLAAQYHFFDSFKMLLREEEYDGPDGPVVESNGITWTTLDLIADYLRIIKDRALRRVTEATNGMLEDHEIRWCLTVPAIWQERDKQLMRRAAHRAGMIGDTPEEEERLMIVLEPEAAAFYCYENVTPRVEPGQAFMVVDCGGGTIDITAYTVREGGYLEELATGQGTNAGAMYVDNQFIGYLAERLSPEVVETYQREEPVDFLEMMDAWERLKRDFDPATSTDTLYIPISKKFGRILERTDNMMLRLTERQGGDEDNIHIDAREMQHAIFEPVLERVVEIVEQQFRAIGAQGLDFMFLVGGFSTSTVLRKRLQDSFRYRVSEIIAPPNPAQAVLQGAVLYGLYPERLSARRSRLTYGVAVSLPFEEGVDDESKRVWVEERQRDYCKDRFVPFVHIGESVSINRAVTETYTPIYKDRDEMTFTLYGSTEVNPRYVDEENVRKLGEIVIKVPTRKPLIDLRRDRWKDRSVDLTMRFGLTEVQIEAADTNTGKSVDTSLRFSYE